MTSPANTTTKQFFVPLGQLREVMLKASITTKAGLVEKLWEPNRSLIQVLFDLILKDNNARKASNKAAAALLAQWAGDAKDSGMDTSEADSNQTSTKSKGKLNTLMAHPEMAYGLLLPIAHVRSHLLMVGYYADPNNPKVPFKNVAVHQSNPPKLWLVPLELVTRGQLSPSPLLFIFDSAPQAFQAGPLPLMPKFGCIKKVNLFNVPSGPYQFTFSMLRAMELDAPDLSRALCSVGFNEIYRERTFFSARKEQTSQATGSQDQVQVVLMPSLIQTIGLAVKLAPSPPKQVFQQGDNELEQQDEQQNAQQGNRPPAFDAAHETWMDCLSENLNALGRLYATSTESYGQYARTFERNDAFQPGQGFGDLPAEDLGVAKRLLAQWTKGLEPLSLSLNNLMPYPLTSQLEQMTQTWPFNATVTAVQSVKIELSQTQKDNSESSAEEPQTMIHARTLSEPMHKRWTLAQVKGDLDSSNMPIYEEPFVLSVERHGEQELLALAKQIAELEGAEQAGEICEVMVAKPQGLVDFCLLNALAMHRLFSASLTDLDRPAYLKGRMLGDEFWDY